MITLVVVSLAAAVLVLVLLGLVAVAIHREDRAAELAGRPPTMLTGIARRMFGLHVRRPPISGAVDDVQHRSCAASGGTSHRAGGSDD